MGIKVLHWASRVFLAGIFFYAGYTKTQFADPAAPFLFEMAVDGYQLLPAWAVIAVARTLPWLEIALGVMLLVGWQLRYIATFCAALLGAFIAMMGITYLRGIEASCGCFGLGEPITPMSLLRDTLFLAPAIFLAVQAWRESRQQIEPSTQPAS
jgi:uncharacterized membrane protein YphA (DoxX/SURF4 family)